MLRITRQLEHTLHLEGRLTRREVGLLREVCRASAHAVGVVDVSRLAFVDELGAASLVALQRRGFEIRGASPFVLQLLERVAS